MYSCLFCEVCNHGFKNASFVINAVSSLYYFTLAGADYLIFPDLKRL